MAASFTCKKLRFLFLTGMLMFASAGYQECQAGKQGELKGNPIDSDVFTTRQRMIVEDSLPPGSKKIFPYEIAKYRKNGYGTWHYGPGKESVKRFDLMPAAYSDASVVKRAKLLHFFTIDRKSVV